MPMTEDQLVKADGELDVDAANQILDEFEARQAAERGDTHEEADDSQHEDTSADADEQSGADDAAAEETASEGDWVATLAEDMRELVESLGLSEEEVREFSGPDELERHTRLLDKQLMKLGAKPQPGEEQEAALLAQEEAAKRQAAQERAAKQQRGEDGKFVKPDGAQDQEDYEPSLSTDDYDDGLVAEIKRMNDHYKRRFERLEHLLVLSEERVRESERQQSDLLVDALGHADLFGESSKPRTAEQKKNFANLMQAATVIQQGMSRLGRDVPITAALLRRALNQEFAEHLTKKERQSLVRKVQSQQRRRLGGGGERLMPNEHAAWTGDPSQDPVLLEAYRVMERESV